MVSINTASPKQANKAAWRNLYQKKILCKFKEVEEFAEKFKNAHAAIEDGFRIGSDGLKLQFIDSFILQRIMERLARKGIVALGMHDSCIVDKRYKCELELTMIEEYEKVFGFVPVVKLRNMVYWLLSMPYFYLTKFFREICHVV
ncbi:hypothetical protein KKB18_01575 [bacterium]|nr:hypothetical protein [bacterium]